MKRTALMLILILCMMFCGTAAGEVEMSIEYVTPKPTPIYEADLSQYNLLELTLLQLNVEEAIRKAKRTTSTPAPSSNEFGIWEFECYIDEFKMPTDNAYIRNAKTIYGTFSNSATDNSKLGVTVLVDDVSASIALFEYGNNLVKNSYSSKEKDYDVYLLDSAGKKHSFWGYMPANGNRIGIKKDTSGLYETEHDFINILKTNRKIHFYIEDCDRRTSRYNFVIEDATGFAAAYEQLLSK